MVQPNEPFGPIEAGPSLWFRSPRYFVATSLLATVQIVAGLAIILYAVVRERTEEVPGGIAVVVLGALLLTWNITRRSPILPFLTAVGSLLQLSTLAYYYYSDFGRDAVLYHRAALVALSPDSDLGRGMAFETTSWTNWWVAQQVAGIYRVFTPSMLLGFVVFATIGMAAKIVLARTFLSLQPTWGRGAEWGALLVMVVPSFALWLSAISKEANAILGLALVVAGVVRPPEQRPRFWLILLGLLVAATTRPHLSMLLAVGVLAHATAHAAWVSQALWRRLTIILGATVLGITALLGAATFFGIEPTVAGFEEVRDDLADTRPQGLSDIEPVPIEGPADVAPAIANVLLRPFLWEVTTVAGLLQAIETTGLLLLAASLLLRSARRSQQLDLVGRRHLRTVRSFTWVYVAIFVYSFSGMYNLGLISRQRIQVLPFLLLLLASSVVSSRRPRRRTITSPLVAGDPAASPGGAHP